MLYKNAKSKRMQSQIITIEDLVPNNHILRKIDKYVDFEFIYDIVEDRYCQDNGRPSIDPVVLVKIALIQYLFGIRSMRQTTEDIELNVAYRWFLGYDFYDEIPHFTTFGKNYQRIFQGTDVFEKIFQNILEQAKAANLVDESIQFVDSTHVKAHANRYKYRKVSTARISREYQEQLEKEIEQDRKKRKKKDLKPPKDDNEEPKKQESVQSTTDPESGLFHKGEHKEVFAYSVETSCDKHGWILGYKAFPGNMHDSTTFYPFYKEVISKTKVKKIVLDAGYKIPAIAKMLLESGIQPVFPYTRQKRKPQTEKPLYKRDYVYDEYNDCYICPENKVLNYSTTTREGYKEYKSDSKICKSCPRLLNCTKSKNTQKVITRHLWYESIEQCEAYRLTEEGKAEYKLRQETIERQFGTAKEFHGFRYTNQKGIEKMGVKAALTFACMNIKKLVKMLDKSSGGGPQNPENGKFFNKLLLNFNFILISQFSF